MDKDSNEVLKALAKAKVSVEAGQYSCGLTFDELIIACRNVGIDLSCSLCAIMFFTGTGTGTGKHSAECFSYREARTYAEVLDNIREALGQAMTHYLVMADDVKELVEAIENDKDAKAVLKKLRER
jgi:hypothetical protein